MTEETPSSVRQSSGSRLPKKKTSARKILEEWRGLPDAPAPDRATLISEVIGKLLPKLGIENRIKEADILSAWSGIVGDFIAQHSRPERLEKGILFVRVMQSSVRYELDRVWKPEIIRKLRERFGDKTIREIKFIL